MSTPSIDSYRVFQLPTPISPNHIVHYKHLRLTSLTTDPTAFTSTVEREKAFTDQEWRQRLDNPETVTMIAATPRTGRSPRGMEPQMLTEEDIDNLQEWIGTLSIVGPDTLRTLGADPRTFPPPFAPNVDREEGSETKVEESDPHALFGMWVHPGMRGAGVGAALIRQAVEVVRTRQKERNKKRVEDGGTEKKAFVMLDVHAENASALKLYEKVGFIRGGIGMKDGFVRMYIVV